MKNAKRIVSLAAALLFALSAASCNFSTAKVESAVLTDADGNIVSSYTAADTIFYAQANLSNAPERTKIIIVWTYIDQNQVIDQTNVYSEEDSETVTSTLEATSNFPTGQYKVEFFVEDRKEADASATFSVVEAPEPSIEDAHMTSNFDSSGSPVDTISEVAPTGTWYVTGVLRNTQADTQVRFIWYDTEGSVIDEYTLDPEGKADIYINGTLELSQIAPEGTYLVEMYIDDNTSPAASVRFDVENVGPELDASLGEFKSFSQTAGNFTIMYPSGWTMIDLPDSMAAGFYPDSYSIDGQSDVNTVIIARMEGLATGYTTSGMLDEWVAETESSGYKDYSKVESGVDTINGREMGMYVYSLTRDSYSLYTFDFIVIDAGDLYLITFTSTDSAVQELYPYVEQMILSFNIL